MQSNRMIGEKQYEMGRPLGTDEWRQTSKESRGGKNIKDAGKGEGHRKDRTALRRDMRRSGKDERWREGAAFTKL